VVSPLRILIMLKKGVITRVGVGLLLVGLLTFAIVTHLKNMALELLVNKQGIALSPDDLRQLVSDLESSDPKRVGQWKSYFHHCINLQSNLAGATRVEDISRLYRLHEQPGRSNYFSHLLLALNFKHQSVGLTRGALLGYLGKPDESNDSAEGQILRYYYKSYGSDWAACIWITNDTVVRFGFNAK